MLTSADLKKLLAAGPGQRIELLQPTAATPDKLARALSALANARGGVLLVPLKVGRKPPSKEIDTAELLDRAMQSLLLCEPRLIVPLPYLIQTEANGDKPASAEAIVIEVPEGLPNVYCVDGRYLIRDNARNATLSAQPLRELMLLRGESTWESTSPSGSSKDDLDWKKIEDYANALQLGEPTTEDVLLRRGCVTSPRKLKPTYAGLLLFGKQPQRWIRGAEMLAVRFKDTEMEDAFARQTISGTLPEQIRKAEAFLVENMSVRSRMANWQRSDETPYPTSVLREAVVNAVAHRDYRLTGNQIQVLMFSNRVEVRSPGKLPGHVTLKNLLKERYSRNEAIVQVLADMGFIERLGYGIDRMMRVMKERNQPAPQFEETDGGFCVSFFAKSSATDADIAAALPQSAQQQRLQKMLDFLKEHSRITSSDYQKLCGEVNPETLRRDFVDMVERRVIMRVGDKRGTHYILK